MSLSQTEIKQLRALSTKKGRRAAGLFLAEGVRLLEDALRSPLRPQRVYYAPSLLSERGLALVRRFRSLRVEAVEVTARDLARISDATTPQGMAAVFAQPVVELSQLCRPAVRSILLCENISDPGNLGTLCRSARAFAFDLAVLVGQCAEPFSPKVVRASAGAILGLPVAVAKLDEVALLARDRGYVVLAADVRGAAEFHKALESIPDGRLILAVGAEAEGLSEPLLALATHRVRVPHENSVESLNAAVAGSILMKECYESARRRSV